MRSHLLRHAPLRAVLAGAAALSLAVSQAPAQVRSAGPCESPPPPCCGTPSPALPGVPGAMAGVPSGTPSGTPSGAPSPFDFTASTGAGAGLSLAGGMSAAGGGESLALDGGGYLDDAIPRTQVRLRFDAAYNDNRPDRAEFFYPKCGCFRQAALAGNRTIGDPGAAGPPMPESRVDYQEVSSYMELAPTERLSAFIEVPYRFINPEQNQNASGIGDINFGGKFALVATQDTFFTLQGRVYVPTGDASKGLGTHHTSVEPALLLYQQLGDRLGFQAELRDWIATDGSDFAGNVLRYGVGVTYLALNGPSFRVMPVAELVGWTVLSGKESAFTGDPIQDAAGDTIVNAKLGVRLGFGSLQERGLLSQSDLYIGYGRALTGEVWYKDILRVEYRMRF